MTTPYGASAFRTHIDTQLSAFINTQRPNLTDLGPELAPFIDAASAFVAGGKRLRPEFCHAGWCAAGGDPTDPGIFAAAAAFEWLQGSALVHDDLMDESDTRRGNPSIHRLFERRHRDAGGIGNAAQFGRSVAVLLGDLMLSWADESLRAAAAQSPVVAANLAHGSAFFDRCKTEVVAGQYLDVAGQTHNEFSVTEAMRVVRFKSAKYTVERPLHVGAALAGADAELIDALSHFGLPLGEAFQLRDDILGVFGDPDVTGKPAGDDLREGKRTVLIARTAERTDATGLRLLEQGLGNNRHVAELRQLIQSTGAAAAVERQIVELEDQAESALTYFETDVQAQLRKLLVRATRRTY